MTTGERIKKKRKEKDLTLEDLSKYVGVSRQTLSRYENGIIGIPSGNIEKIAKALNTTPAYLMGWEEEKKETSLETIAAHALRDLTEEEIKAVITLAKHIKSEK